MEHEYLIPLVEAEDIADQQRYGEDELPFIRSLVLGAQSLLFNAEAFVADNPLTEVTIMLIVGHWLENRDGMNYDYRNVNTLPFNVQSMVNTLRFYRTDHLVVEGDADA